VLDDDGKSVYSLGETARITVFANSCFVLELKRADKQAFPILYGAEGTAKQRGDTIEVDGISGMPGQRIPLRVRLSKPGAIKFAIVNGVRQKFSVIGQEICLDLQFAGGRYVRELDFWTQADGESFDFPNRAMAKGLKLTTTFMLNRDVVLLLEEGKPKNFSEMGRKIAGWQEPGIVKRPSFSDPYSYHNFICERPERLWLIIPFLEKTQVDATLNGQHINAVMWDMPSQSAFADVTDLVKFGAENRLELSLGAINQRAFMGPFLLYPQEAPTSEVLAQPESVDQQKIYSGPLLFAPPSRYRRGAGPQVTEAKMMRNVTLDSEAELRVKLNQPSERIHRVMYFDSGFTWMGQHSLQYDNKNQSWTAMVKPGDRGRIQENEDIYVWAEGADGLRSEYYPVKVGWDFVRHEIGVPK
jgi:hypothetical protein